GPILAWKGSVFARQQLLRERGLVQAPGQEEAARIRQALDDVSRKIAQGATALSIDDKQVQAMTSRREELERELAKYVPAARLRRQGEQLTLARLKESLPPDVALVDFLEFLHDQVPAGGKGVRTRRLHLLAVVVHPKRPAALLDLGPSETIARDVDR